MLTNLQQLRLAAGSALGIYSETEFSFFFFSLEKAVSQRSHGVMAGHTPCRPRAHPPVLSLASEKRGMMANRLPETKPARGFSQARRALCESGRGC